MPVTATVTTRPHARRVAIVVPARSIWQSSQPPKMSPCGLVSAGIAIARKAGSVFVAGSLVSNGLGMNWTCPLITQTSIASQRQRFAVQYVGTFLPGEHLMHVLSLAHPARRREAPVTSLGNISMTSNVHAFERVKLRRTAPERPDRAEVEAAFRTIIRWTGDDPDRDGL